MKNELIKQFVKKTLRKIVVFAFLMIVIAALCQPASVILTNQIALGQMQNSDEAYIFMNLYSKLQVIARFIFSVVILWFMCTIGRDTYKFVSTINNSTNEKEN